MHELRCKIENSNYTSKHVNEKAIKVNLDSYAELSIINDRLTLIDCNGHQYTAINAADLEDLIDILNDVK